MRRFGTGNEIAGAVRRVCRHVNNHRRIANGPRRQEKLFKQTFGAFRHRSDSESVGKNLGADAAGAVVDRESVANTVQSKRQRVWRSVRLRLLKLRKRLHSFDLVVIHDGEFAERLIAIGFDWIRTIGACREIVRGPVR